MPAATPQRLMRVSRNRELKADVPYFFFTRKSSTIVKVLKILAIYFTDISICVV